MNESIMNKINKSIMNLKKEKKKKSILQFLYSVAWKADMRCIKSIGSLTCFEEPSLTHKKEKYTNLLIIPADCLEAAIRSIKFYNFTGAFHRYKF